MSHAVEDGELKHVSPSQIKTYQECPRKWYYQKVERIPEPKKAHLELGGNIHKELEHYYLNGATPSHPSVLAALEHHDTPNRGETTYLIEEPRDQRLGITAAGVPVRGRIDVQIPPVDGTVTILDWKSTSSFSRCKTPEELARDAQGVIYLKYAFETYPSADTGVFKHVYLKTKGGSGVRVVPTDPLDRPYIDEMYETLERTVAQMKTDAAAIAPAEVRADTTTCSKWGGCPYAAICPSASRKKNFLDALDVTNFPTQGETSMALSDRLKNRTALINPPDAAQPVKAPQYVPPPQVTAAPPTAIVVTTASQPSATSGTAPTTTFVLYVDCAPTKARDVLRLEEEIARRTPTILAALRQSHPNDVPATAVDVREVKFGVGTTALVANFKREPPSGVVVASAVGLSGQVVETLAPMASDVIRATR